MQDLYHNAKTSSAINSTTVTDNTAIVGNIVDFSGFDSALFAIQAGSLADADATFAVTMVVGDDSALADGAAVAAGDLLGSLAGASFTFADDNVVKKLGYTGNKRYGKLTITPTNNTGSATFSAVLVQGRPRSAPVA